MKIVKIVKVGQIWWDEQHCLHLDGWSLDTDEPNNARTVEPDELAVMLFDYLAHEAHVALAARIAARLTTALN